MVDADQPSGVVVHLAVAVVSSKHAKREAAARVVQAPFKVAI